MCLYSEWANPHRLNAFFRRMDTPRLIRETYTMHPLANATLPRDGFPGKSWVYQNTLVDMDAFAPVLDAAFAAKGIPKMAKPVPPAVTGSSQSGRTYRALSDRQTRSKQTGPG